MYETYTALDELDAMYGSREPSCDWSQCCLTQGFLLKRPLKAKGTHIAFLKEVKAFFFVQFTA